jgi:aminoglycoside 3-N-acetyltransferase
VARGTAQRPPGGERRRGGRRAAWLVEPHPDDDGYGEHSPFARLVQAGGQVLMLGAPLDTVTLLHHAEAVARVPDKRRVTYEALGLGDEDPCAVLAREALTAGAGVRGRVGEAECHLFDAPALVAFATAWLQGFG